MASLPERNRPIRHTRKAVPAPWEILSDSEQDMERREKRRELIGLILQGTPQPEDKDAILEQLITLVEPD